MVDANRGDEIEPVLRIRNAHGIFLDTCLDASDALHHFRRNITTGDSRKMRTQAFQKLALPTTYVKIRQLSRVHTSGTKIVTYQSAFS